MYLFDSPGDARAMIAAYEAIETTDYVGAVEVQELPSVELGDAAAVVRFRTTSGRSLEAVWAQGLLVGQVILRYLDDAEGEDVDLLAALARVQVDRMAAALP